MWSKRKTEDTHRSGRSLGSEKYQLFLPSATFIFFSTVALVSQYCSVFSTVALAYVLKKLKVELGRKS